MDAFLNLTHSETSSEETDHGVYPQIFLKELEKINNNIFYRMELKILTTEQVKRIAMERSAFKLGAGMRKCV